MFKKIVIFFIIFILHLSIIDFIFLYICIFNLIIFFLYIFFFILYKLNALNFF